MYRNRRLTSLQEKTLKQKREAVEKAYLDLVPEKAREREWEKNQDLLGWLKGLERRYYYAKL